jgi:hypothetical protein
MDAATFDGLTRRLASTAPRRWLLGRVAAAWLGAALVPLPHTASARKGKSKKKKKLRLNTFGCVDVGGTCRGKDANCCSNICQGKKPKKGKKDKSHCVAHDQSTCLPGQAGEVCGGLADVPCVTTTGLDGGCFTTTGNAGYCAGDGNCFPCKKDADCILHCGPQAACIKCPTECASVGGAACDGSGACVV